MLQVLRGTRCSVYLTHCSIAHRPNFGSLAPALRRQGGKEVLYHKIQAAYQHLIAQPSTTHIKLQPFTPEDARTFIANSLKGVEVRARAHLVP